jgi:heptosyltransferase-2
MSEKILVRAPNWLGDVVMGTPLVRRLGERHPGAVIDVMVKGSLAAVFQGMPGVRKVIPLSPPDVLKGEGYGTAYVLPGSFSSAWNVFRAGIPERIGYAGEGRSVLLTKALRLDERFHYVRRYLGLIGEEGREVGREDFYFPVQEPSFPLPAGPLLALAPGSRAVARRWFPERFAAAVARGCRKPVVDLCGKTSLPELAGVLKRCGALLTNESGLMHVAWAVGTPVVVAAGPSEQRCTSPFGPGVRVLQHREIPCVPCVRNECYRAGEDRLACLKAIGAEEAVGALASVAGAQASSSSAASSPQSSPKRHSKEK